MLPNVTVSAVASSRSMCLLSDAKTHLGITGTGQDLKLTRLINAASGLIARLLGRDPWLQTYSEKRPGEGGQYLYLSRWPLLGDPSSVTFGTGDSPTTVDSDDYSVAGRRLDRLYNSTGWSRTATNPAERIANLKALAYTIAYTAGWVMPDQITQWSATASVSASAWFQKADATAAGRTDYPLIFRADATGGTTGSTEPTWPAVAGGTVTDNGITWTAYEQRLPADLEEAALMLVTEWFGGWAPANVSYEALETWAIRYTSEQRALSAAVNAIVRGYR